MKKFLVTMLSVLCSVCLLFGITACRGQKYTVTLDPNFEGGSAVTREADAGSSLEEPEAPFVREGKVFDFWSLDAAGTRRAQFPIKVDGDLTLYACWRDAAKFTLTFSIGGATAGTAPQAIVAAEGETVTLPTGEGIGRDLHVLGGWQDANGVKYDLGASYTVTGDAAFTAVWERAVTVRFEANGGTGTTPEDMLVAEGASFTFPAAGGLSKAGYTFDGWLDAQNTLHPAGSSAEAPSATTAVYRAAWHGAYVISFDAEVTSLQSPLTDRTGTSLTTGDRISLPEAVPVEDMEFTGWRYNGETYGKNTRFTVGYEDIEFEAVYVERGVNIEYRDADRSLIRSVFYKAKETPAAPAGIYPTALSEFTGWVDAQGEPVDLATIEQDTAVYANYSVRFADASLFTYTASGGGYYISGKSGSYPPADSMNLPAAYQGKPIYGIADGGTLSGLFVGETYLHNVRIPSNWTKIGAYAFYNSSITSVEFAQNCKLATIGNSAFSRSKLTSIAVPDSVTTVGTSVFDTCEQLQTATFGQNSGITKFSDGTENERSSIFANCTALENVTLPGHLEVIGLMAFQYCPIVTITFPASMRIVGQSAFNYCDKLQTVVIPDDCALEEIQRAGFGWCKKLQSIKLPETVRSIAYNAFTTCEVMESITFGNVTEIGETAFFRCNALKRVNSTEDGTFNLPASLREIGVGAFAQCSEMKQVNFAAGSELKTVGMYAFAANLYHDADHYPEGITKGDYNYDSAPMSLESIEFPAGVEEIGKYVLYNTFSLKTLNVAAGNTHYTADGRGLYENATHKLIAFALGSEEAAYTMAADCVAMDEYVLSGDMREAQVYGTPKVKEFTLSQGLTVVPYTAFLCHAELTTVVIPAGSKLTEIGEAAFANCIKLASFNFEAATELKTIGVEAFEDVAITAISLPATLQEIGNYAFYKADIVTVNFAAESALQTIGIGAFMGNDHIKEVGSNEFIGSKLTAFTLPKNVESVGTLAFAYTSSLETFTFEEGSKLKGFANNMFQWSGVQNIVNIPETLTAIGESAFARTSRLTAFTMNTVGSIGLYAFSNSAIQTVTLDGTYETLTVRTFDTCRSLTSVTLGRNMKKVDNYAFIDCSGLQDITLPESCTAIGACAFRNCTSLKSITLPAQGVVATETNAFTHVINEQTTENLALEKVYVPASQVEHYKYDSGWIAFKDIIEAIPA